MNTTTHWDIMNRENMINTYNKRQEDPKLPALITEAASKGYKPAPLTTLLVDSSGVAHFSWKGHIWIESGGEWDIAL